jgi:pyruvate/2-oxoglutarate dehydrogenase complex dihydrolipoamide acyltransferase (E2) component
MATEIRMPQMGLTMTDGVIGAWYKQVGDQVKTGEVLLNVETDKLTNDIESEAEGTILAIYAHAGDVVPVQGRLCVVDQPDEAITFQDAAGKPAK